MSTRGSLAATAYNEGMVHRYVLHNGKIHDVSERLLRPGQVGLLNGWGVFSTLRVCQGVLFAWERHYERMRKDAALLGVPFPADANAMRDQLLLLVEANEAWDATLRVVVVRNRGGLFEGPNLTSDYDVIAFTRPVAEWGTGLRLAVTPAARYSSSRFAGAKTISWAMNLTLLEEARARGFDETILLDDRGRVAECTSANIFLATGNVVWTPPLTCGCLPGVTRAILLEEIRVPGIEIREQEFRIADLERADEVFITSSTRDLLAVQEIEGVPTPQTGDVRVRLNKAFSTYFLNYIANAKKPARQPS
jgi:branched-chain amino acid aminotransferase